MPKSGGLPPTLYSALSLSAPCNTTEPLYCNRLLQQLELCVSAFI